MRENRTLGPWRLPAMGLGCMNVSWPQGAATEPGERGLRSLDALHLAVAVPLRASLTGIITYDARMAEAAMSLGFVVESPR